MQRIRLVSFAKPEAKWPKIGLLLNEGKYAANPIIIDLKTAMFQPFLHKLTRNLSIQAICKDQDNVYMPAIRQIAAIVHQQEDASLLKAALPFDSVRILPPITPVRNVICIGKNYSDHIAEVKKRDSQTGTDTPAASPKYPMFFTKAPSTVIGYGSPVPSHNSLTKWLDYEAELAVIIGKGGVNIPVETAMLHVFGYTCANDVSARDLQRRHGQFFKGKTLDGTCPLGPCIVPASELDPTNLAIKLTLNGTVRQNSRTSKMLFDIPNIISSLSEGFTLVPGDIILTGTPDGVAYAADPPFSLVPGDDMVVEIENIGQLRNKVE